MSTLSVPKATLELAGKGQSLSQSVSHTFQFHQCKTLLATVDNLALSHVYIKYTAVLYLCVLSV